MTAKSGALRSRWKELSLESLTLLGSGVVCSVAWREKVWENDER
ncbi:hypothetical protein E2C01_092332 [Portunus trituberculatus]|uniref:Uncharacterized protein n=1 Tax=Portunus trituberculatus TaxID=210409 RepID=A0A5B7JXH3_PORTR|nr:hypothetical protein [Portunus trituberculatus]